jgi:hypothetical protein
LLFEECVGLEFFVEAMVVEPMLGWGWEIGLLGLHVSNLYNNLIFQELPAI